MSAAESVRKLRRLRSMLPVCDDLIAEAGDAAERMAMRRLRAAVEESRRVVIERERRATTLETAPR